MTGLYILHSNKIIHSDVKPDNILFRNGIAKVADFSTANFEYIFDSGIVGTRYYRAPEVILGLNLSSAIDIWSAGCVMFELISGNILFKPTKFAHISQSENHIAAIIKLCGSIPNYMANGYYAYKYFPKNVRTLNDINRTINIKRINRYSLRDILGDNSAIDLLEQMLQIDPNKRASAKSLLQHHWFD